ncbi:hypothetical protein CEUSTIGMA_g1585.t1 [Chlamydomonas eustigma]|uniref:Pep3/Vps18 beta-propeller domain-containing protein n=1 Tax=Chlamydomonas eustigma TaxID=1157962 RepID=A0A250WTQ7_9CHLO|nr:hypothetical protein CEUSTIGMA_g1585.t1 [Chlamydomonas eustigma]|eukprot:GAX74136.1 hypothetical protein CEUSTIGMA_g1585.t1 [Chlamydomonas eustigma]
MNLLNDFESLQSPGYSYKGQLDLSRTSDDPQLAKASSEGFDLPLLSVDVAVKQIARGRGDVLGIACSNGNVVVATSRGYLIRYFWDEYGSERVSEIEVNKQVDSQLTVFMDPSANHILISVKSASGSEVHYAHRRWSKSRPLSKLKGITVTAVGWARQTNDAERSPASVQSKKGVVGKSAGMEDDSPSDSCTGSIILGTDLGALMEIVLDENLLQHKKEPRVKQLLQLPTSPGSNGSSSKVICTVRQEALPSTGSGYLVLIATSRLLYVLSGGPTLESLFAKYTNTKLSPLMEAVVPSHHSQLHLYYPGSMEEWGRSSPSRFGWIVGDMVYHGELDIEGGGEPYVRNMHSLPLPGALGSLPNGGSTTGGPSLGGVAASSSWASLNRASSPSLGVTSPKGIASPIASTPTSLIVLTAPDGDNTQWLAMTEYHFILLKGDLLYAVNRVSGKVVSEVEFRSPLNLNVSGESSRSFDGLVKDEVSGSIYAYSDESLYEVTVLQESRDMWKVYLKQQDWDEALKHCSSSSQRDKVHCTRAEAAMSLGDYTTAAIHWAKIVGGKPTFEEIALKLVEIAGQLDDEGTIGGTGGYRRRTDRQDALSTFLSTKLTVLGRGDRAQATMVVAWLTELYLDQINRELLESGGRPSTRCLAKEAALRTFLTTSPSLEALDPGTTCTLLAGYGRMEELVLFAGARGDHEAVLEYLMLHPTSASKALAVMRKPSCSTELIYKFAPALVMAITEEAMDFFITAKPPLDARRLIPAMIKFCDEASSPEGRRHALRYVEFAIEQLGCEDSSVHNLAVALHSLAPDEASLLSYLSRARDLLGQPLYDVRHSLRLATERGKLRACVKLLCGLGMYEDAVALALGLDLELAKSVANMPPEEEEALRRKLWLAVARHVVQRGSATSAGNGGNGDKEGRHDQPTSNIKQAVEFLKEAGGLLKLEDILPFFPDFVMIDNFKDAICDSLERYNKQVTQLKTVVLSYALSSEQIEDLRREMSEATHIADSVRRDLKLLSTRIAALSSEQACVRCGRPLSVVPKPCGLPSGGAIQPFFVFPTGNAYHGVCCAAEVMELANVQQQSKIQSILVALSKAPKSHQELSSDFQSLKEQLVSEVACEDPRSGEITVRLVDLPFISDSDLEEQAMWAI